MSKKQNDIKENIKKDFTKSFYKSLTQAVGLVPGRAADLRIPNSQRSSPRISGFVQMQFAKAQL